MSARVRVALLASVIAATIAACDLAAAPDPGPPQDWRLGPVKPGDTLVLPRNPCPRGTETVGHAFDKEDGLFGIELGRSPVDDTAALRLDVPMNVPPGRYNYVFSCYAPGVVLLDLVWEIRVRER
jgi:hypothetical protein